jgi:site-specific DNA-methyltransferase (adenine-specific)/site-specific DNA-methyltransferase (cytosine-N4-specific)
MPADIDTIRSDCRKALRAVAAGSVDVVVTGVPFWSSKAWGWSGAIGNEGSFPAYLANMKEVFWQVRRTLKDDGHVWVVAGDCRDRPHLAQPARLLPIVESLGLHLRDAFVWTYRLTVPHFQTVYWFTREHAEYPTRIPTEHGFVWGIPMDKGDPVTFPEDLVERCLEMSGKDAPAHVLDPFSGTGTVGRVASSMGYRSTMIDGRDHA